MEWPKRARTADWENGTKEVVRTIKNSKYYGKMLALE